MNSNDGNSQEPTRSRTIENGSGSGYPLTQDGLDAQSQSPSDREELPRNIGELSPNLHGTDFSSKHLVATANLTAHHGDTNAQPNDSATPISSIIETERTVVSASPIAEAQEFYPTGSVASLARILIGQQLDHYQLHELVGGGGMGAVFKASDMRLDRIVAVKVIPNLGRDQESLKRFRVEAQSAAKLDHPNIARVYYVGETPAWSYIVFEFIEGVNLRDLVTQNAPISIDDAIFYTIQIAQALQHASDRAVVHRDIKPSNALVTSDGLVKVVDMGLARTTSLDQSSNDLTASGVTLGTFDYISPEQARDPRAADVRSDLYSLGCTLYYLLVGRPPYHQGTAIQKLLMHGETPPEDPRHFRDDIPSELAAVVRKLMAKRPRDRYQQPLDLVADLHSLAELLDLPKSSSGKTAVINPITPKTSLIREAFPWIISCLFLFLSSGYLYRQYIESGNFTISREIISGFNPAISRTDVKSTNQAPNPSIRNRSDKSEGMIVATQVSPIKADQAIKEPPAGIKVPLNVQPSGDVSDLNNDSKASDVKAGQEGVLLATSIAGSNKSINETEKQESLKVDKILNGRDPGSVTTVTPPNTYSSPLSGSGKKDLTTSSPSVASTIDSPATSADGGTRSDLPKPGSTIAKPEAAELNGIEIAKTTEQTSPQSRFPNANVIVVRSIDLKDTKRESLAPNTAPTIVRTLSEAVKLANENQMVDEIWIDDEQIVISETLPITRTQCLIRGVTSKRCRIQWIPQPTQSAMLKSNDSNSKVNFDGEPSSPLWRLSNTKLSLENLDFQVTSPDSGSGTAVVATVGSGSLIKLSNAVVTLNSENREWETAFVFITGNTTKAPPQIELEGVIVRGTGSLIQMASGIRSELRWRNGLLAVNGRLLDTNGASTVSKTPPTIRMDLEDLTIDAQRGLARVRITADHPYPVCISRDAKNCTFVCDAASSLISFEGVSWKDSTELNGLITSWVDLRGSDNAYDERVNALVRLQGMSGKSKQIGFEASTLGVFSERAPETSVRWLRPTDISKPFNQRSPLDYLQQTSSTFRSGMRPEALPTP